MNRYKLFKAGVDVNQGLKRFDNNKEFYESLLVYFLNDTNYIELQNAMKEKNVKKAFGHAHALKGVTGNLSFTRLYGALIPFVEKLREGDYQGAQELYGEVQAAYEVVEDAIKGDK